MIIPIRCFTCGKVIADKWEAYERMCAEKDKKKDIQNDAKVPINFDKNHKAEVLNKLGLDRVCCRRHMLGHVDLINDI
jgi:DNA-directed RNA polymerases I, II, and III subunit RPABC5